MLHAYRRSNKYHFYSPWFDLIGVRTHDLLHSITPLHQRCGRAVFDHLNILLVAILKVGQMLLESIVQWDHQRTKGPSLSYGSWIYNMCNQCLSLLTLWVRIPIIARCTRYNIMWYVGGFHRFLPLIKLVCDLLRTGPVSSTNKTDRRDISEILLKMALNTLTPWICISQW